mgnify:CR=1 FL=1
MTILRTILVDDEADSIDVVSILLREIDPNIQIVAKCDNADEAIAQIKKHQPDLVLLDIEMPGKNGFDVLKAFDPPDFQVIFITGYDKYALKAIKFSAANYILKPVDIKELREAIEKVQMGIGRQDGRLAYLSQADLGASTFEKVIVSSKGGYEILDLSRIVSIESQAGNYSIFFHEDGTQTLATKSLSHYEELFQHTELFRIHRSWIVNMAHVRSFDKSKGKVILTNGVELEVAHRRKYAFSNALKSRYIS